MLLAEGVSGKGWRERVVQLFPPGQFVRYVCVGCFNTLFGFVSYATALTLLRNVLPVKYLYLTVVLASATVTPINISVAFLGYKFVVFQSKGSLVREWLKCFAVYGVGWVPALVTLSVATRLLQGVFHRYAVPLRAMVGALEVHLSGPPLRWVQHMASGRAAAGYVAGLLLIFFAMIWSFVGHKHVTFRQKRA